MTLIAYCLQARRNRVAKIQLKIRLKYLRGRLMTKNFCTMGVRTPILNGSIPGWTLRNTMSNATRSSILFRYETSLRKKKHRS